jgi:chorismate mutase
VLALVWLRRQARRTRCRQKIGVKKIAGRGENEMKFFDKLFGGKKAEEDQFDAETYKVCFQSTVKSCEKLEAENIDLQAKILALDSDLMNIAEERNAFRLQVDVLKKQLESKDVKSSEAQTKTPRKVRRRG